MNCNNNNSKSNWLPKPKTLQLRLFSNSWFSGCSVTSMAIYENENSHNCNFCQSRFNNLPNSKQTLKKNRQRLLKFCQICSHFNDFTLFGYQYYLQTTFSFRTTPKIQQDLKLPRQSRKKPSRKPGCQNGPTYLKSLLLSYLVGFVKSM